MDNLKCMRSWKKASLKYIKAHNGETEASINSGGEYCSRKKAKFLYII